jgi:predicted flap endonuclease-1-like 5' DNA nuclease
MGDSLLKILAIAVLGFGVGWAVEFLIDLLYWRRRAGLTPPAEPSSEPEEPAESLDELEILRRSLAERDHAVAEAMRVSAERATEVQSTQLLVSDHQLTIVDLREQLAKRQAELDALRAEVEASDADARRAEAEAEVARLAENLAQREEALAELKRQLAGHQAELNEAQADLERQQAEAEDAAAAYQQQIEQLRDELTEAHTQAALDETADNLAQLERQYNEAMALLADARTELVRGRREAEEATRLLDQQRREAEQLSERLAQAQADLEELRERERERLVIEETVFKDEDNLTEINGIGRIFARKLERAGIVTYEMLSETSEEDLKEILGTPRWRTPNVRSWRKQARQLAEQKQHERRPQTGAELE